jgi:cytochrome c-type biogenesis protein CcmH/NrfG
MATSGSKRERGTAPNREQLLQMAITTAKQNNRSAARLMFRKVLSEDSNNERAMMWMAKLAETKAERKVWLERVLEVNPNNDLARDTLQRLSYRRSARDNRVLPVFGVLAVVLLILGTIVVLALISSG